MSSRQRMTVKVTPELAKELLAKNTRNRKVNSKVVEGYVRDILNDNWLNTHSPILVGSDGILIDGQHRLIAVVQAGIAVEMEIIYGCDPKIRFYVDRGKSRTVADVLEMKGFANRAVLAATCNILSKCLRTQNGDVHPIWNYQDKTLQQETIDLAETYPIVTQAVHWSSGQSFLRSLYRTETVPSAALCLTCYQKGAEEFFTKLVNADCKAGDPISTLIKTLSKWKNTTLVHAINASTASTAKLVFTGRMFKAFQKGKTVSGVRPPFGSYSDAFNNDWTMADENVWFNKE